MSMFSSICSTRPKNRATFATSAIIGAIAVLGVAIPAAVGETVQPAFSPRNEDPKDYPAGTGRDDTFYACTACHAFKLVAQQGLSRDKWDETFTYMTERHKMPEITGKDRMVMLDYLSTTFGPKVGRSARGWKNPFIN